MNVVVRGAGPPVLFIHGSGADHQTWIMQLKGLPGRLRCIAYDRRGVAGDPLPIGGRVYRVQDHAADAARVIEANADGPVVLCCSSFGGVIGLELARTRSDLVRGALLFEPPLPPSDVVAAAPSGFGCYFDRVVAERGGPAGAELFLRTVLGDAVYDRVPMSWRKRSTAGWRQIRADMASLSAYRPRYDQLGSVSAPVVIAAGDRPGSMFLATVEALAASLGNASVSMLEGASHMGHADCHHAFNRVLLELVARDSA